MKLGGNIMFITSGSGERSVPIRQTDQAHIEPATCRHPGRTRCVRSRMNEAPRRKSAALRGYPLLFSQDNTTIATIIMTTNSNDPK
jgi:hypothetical protein